MSDIINKKAKFPNEFSMNLTIGSTLVAATDPSWAKVGYEHIKKAFQIRPSQISIIELVYAARRKKLNKLVTADIKQYFEEFTKNKDALSKKGGYEKRLLAAIMAGKYLAQQIKRNDPELAKQCASLAKKYTTEQKQVSKGSRW